MLACFCVSDKNSVIIDIIEILALVVVSYLSAPYPFHLPDEFAKWDFCLWDDGSKQHQTAT